MTEPLGCENSTLLHNAVAQALTALKQEDGTDLHVIGSARLVRTLITLDLVDEFRLMSSPVILGGGKRILPDDGVWRDRFGSSTARS